MEVEKSTKQPCFDALRRMVDEQKRATAKVLAELRQASVKVTADHGRAASDLFHNLGVRVSTAGRLPECFPSSVVEASIRRLEVHDYSASYDLNMEMSNRCSMVCPNGSTGLILSMASPAVATTATRSTVSFTGDSTSTASSDTACKLFDRMPRCSDWSSDCALSIMVCRALYPISEDLLHPILAPYGVKQLVVNPRATTAMGSQYMTAIVEMNSRDAAARARVALQGQCLFDGCCYLRVSFALPYELPTSATSSEATSATAQAACVMHDGVSPIEMPPVDNCVAPTQEIVVPTSTFSLVHPCTNTVSIASAGSMLQRCSSELCGQQPYTEAREAYKAEMVSSLSQIEAITAAGKVSLTDVSLQAAHGVTVVSMDQIAFSNSDCVDPVSLDTEDTSAEKVFLDTEDIFLTAPILSEVSTFQPQKLFADRGLSAFVQWPVPSCTRAKLHSCTQLQYSPLPPTLQSVTDSKRKWTANWLEVREDRGSFERNEVAKLKHVWPPPLGMCMTLSMGNPPRSPCLYAILIFMCIASVLSYLNRGNSIEEPKPPWSLVTISSNLVIVSEAMHLTDISLEFIQFEVATTHGSKSYSCLDSTSKDDQFSNVTWVMQPRVLLVKDMVTLPVVDLLDSIIDEVTFKVCSGVSPENLPHIVRQFITWDPWPPPHQINGTELYTYFIFSVELRLWPSWDMSLQQTMVRAASDTCYLMLTLRRHLSRPPSLHVMEFSWIRKQCPNYKRLLLEGAPCYYSTCFAWEIAWCMFCPYCRPPEAYVLDMKHSSNKDMSSWNYPTQSVEPSLPHCDQPYNKAGKLLWDLDIWELLAFYWFFAQAAGQALFSHDYYLNIVQVHLDGISDISYRYHLAFNRIKESHVLWDPGGSRWHWLGDKPNLKEGGLSGTPSILGLDRTIGCQLLGFSPLRSHKEKSIQIEEELQRTRRLGTEGLRPRSRLWLRLL